MMSIENLEHKASLAALELYVVDLLQKSSGEAKDQVTQKFVEMVREIHQGFLETLESKNATLDMTVGADSNLAGGARITDVRASARGYANYEQWIAGTKLDMS